MRPNKLWIVFCATFGMTGCASTGGGEGDTYSTITGGDHVEEVRPDVFLIVSKSGFYIPDEEMPLMVVDKLMSKISGQAKRPGSGLSLSHP